MTLGSQAIASKIVCEWCGVLHPNIVCHKVKSLEYYEDGSLKKVEFKSASDYPSGHGSLLMDHNQMVTEFVVMHGTEHMHNENPEDHSSAPTGSV